MRTIRLLLALSAVLVAAVALAACGGGIPANAVAQVGDQPIPRSEFDHWMRVAAVQVQSQSGGRSGPVAVPDPPDFTACVAARRRTQPKPAPGQPPVTDAQLRSQCQREYTTLRDAVLPFLITARWLQGEAAQQGVTVTDQQVRQQFQQIKRQNFPKDQAYQAFLRQSGQTQEDILFRLRINALQSKLQQKVTQGTANVTPAEIQRYYQTHRQQFGRPEQRDLRVVLTKTRPQADAARKALDSGQPFAKVAKRYSIDPASKGNGGQLLGVMKGREGDPAFDQAVFSAPKGKIVGPVKTQFGWVVFRVGKVIPASQQSLAQARPSIRQILVTQHQQQALRQFNDRYRAEWTAKTDCRDGFVVASCKNAPKPQPKPGQATTAAPPANGGG